MLADSRQPWFSSPTVQRGVHPTDIDQQTHHGHVHGRRALRQQLVLQDLAAFAALGHGIEVDVGEGVRGPGLRLRLLREDLLVVLKDQLEEVVLDVLAPQRDAVILLEVLDLVPTVDRRHAAICIAARGRGRRRVLGARAVAVSCGLGAVRRIRRIGKLHIVRRRGIGLRRRASGVVHGGLSGENVSQAVSGVGFVGARRRFHGHLPPASAAGRCAV